MRLPTAMEGFLARITRHESKPSQGILASKQFFKNLDIDQRLSECTFTVVDSEMTGLNPRQDEILALGAVRIRELGIVAKETFYTLVQPKKGPSRSNTLIHRITPQQLLSAPRLRKVLPGFLDFLGQSLIVGHHIGLDMGFLNIACKTVFGHKMVHPCVDTMRLAMVYQEECFGNYYDQFQGDISYNLTDLSRKHGLPLFNAHNALTDAMQTAYLFLFLVRKLRQGGIETLRDLYMAGRSWRWYL